MFNSNRLRLLMTYLAFWLLGMATLNAFPGPVQAGYAALAQPAIAQAGDIAGTPREGAKPVSLTSRQIGLKKSSRIKTPKSHQILPVKPQGVSISLPGPTGGIPTGPARMNQPDPSVKPLDLTGFPSLDFAFPSNTVTPDDINNLRFQVVPPDTMGAAGPSQFVMAINGMLRVFTKATGVPEQPFGATDPDLDTFFSEVMTPVAENVVNHAAFPRVRYDRYSGRWFILASDMPGGPGISPNRILLAVSSGPVITSATAWKFFYFQPADFIPDPYKATYQVAYSDYPTLGIDANALYIGVNFYTTGNNSFVNTGAFVVRKSTVLGSGSIVVTGFPPLIGKEGPFAPQGVDNLDSSVNEGYFIGVNISGGTQNTNLLQMRRVTNPGGNPILSPNIPVTVPVIQPPLFVPHKGGGSDTKDLLNPVDSRLINAVIHNGRLWTAHNIGVDGNGNTTSRDRDGARWYEINLPTDQVPSPSLRQFGTVFDNSPSMKFYWMPSLTVSGQGNTVMGLNVAGTNDYISAAFTGRMESDSLYSMRPPVLYQTSTVPYTPDNNAGNDLLDRLWGYYSFTSLDPEDNMTFWTIQEYAYNADGYGIQVARIKAPPTANIVSANPSHIISGQRNIDITVMGSSVNGSGFYEPGSGFPKHLTASSGSGVIVNSVTYLSPTTVKINVSAVGVTPGQYDLNITNPDGQTSIATNLLNVTCAQVVTDNAGDGETGSLRSAINNILKLDGCPNISLENVTHPIILNETLELPAGINITTANSCSAGKVEITGNGFEGDGLVLKGGAFFGLNVHGFKGRQIVAYGNSGSNGATGPNIMSCMAGGTS